MADLTPLQQLLLTVYRDTWKMRDEAHQVVGRCLHHLSEARRDVASKQQFLERVHALLEQSGIDMDRIRPWPVDPLKQREVTGREAVPE